MAIAVDRFAEQVGALIPGALTEPAVLAGLFGLSLVLFFGSLAAMPVVVARMRDDYFVRRAGPGGSWIRRHPAVRAVALIVRNALGVVLLLAGLAMMVLPGQGIVTVLVALTLLSFPGKRRLELRIVRQRHVRRAVDWLRARAGRPPFIVPDPDPRPSADSPSAPEA